MSGDVDAMALVFQTNLIGSKPLLNIHWERHGLGVLVWWQRTSKDCWFISVDSVRELAMA